MVISLFISAGCRIPALGDSNRWMADICRNSNEIIRLWKLFHEISGLAKNGIAWYLQKAIQLCPMHLFQYIEW
jgi:hypothetical protein